MTEKPHHIAIVGGGAGGLLSATKLGNRLGRRGRAEIILIDDALTHIRKPLLHEVAVGPWARKRRRGFPGPCPRPSFRLPAGPHGRA